MEDNNAMWSALMSRDQYGWNNPFLWFALFQRGGWNGWNGGDCGYGSGHVSEQIADNNNFANLTNAVNSAAHSAAERVVNSELLNGRDILGKMAECCCENKVLGLQNHASEMSRIDQLANGVTQGFASLGFLTEKNINAVLQGQKDQTQVILSALSNHWTQDLRDRLFEMSQQAQTASIVNQLRPTT